MIFLSNMFLILGVVCLIVGISLILVSNSTTMLLIGFFVGLSTILCWFLGVLFERRSH
jgi:uncharacterized membrane protein